MANIRIAPGVDRTTTPFLGVGPTIFAALAVNGVLVDGEQFDSSDTAFAGYRRVGVRYPTPEVTDEVTAPTGSITFETVLNGAQGEVLGEQAHLTWREQALGDFDLNWPLTLGPDITYDYPRGRQDPYRPGAGGGGSAIFEVGDVPAQSNTVITVTFPNGSPPANDLEVLYNLVIDRAGLRWFTPPLVVEAAVTQFTIAYDASRDEGLNPDWSPSGAPGYAQVAYRGHPADTRVDPDTGLPYPNPYPLTVTGSTFLVIGYENRTPPPTVNDMVFRRVRNRDDGLSTGVYRAHSSSQQRSVRQRGYF